MPTTFDPTNPLPKFNVDLPKVNVAGFLPSFGSTPGISFNQNHMPDLSFGQNSFLSGFKSFGSFLGGGNPSGRSFQWGFGNSPSYASGTYQFPSFMLPQKPLPINTGSMGSGSIGSATGGASVLNQYDQAFKNAGAAYGIDPNWLKAIAMEEAGWTGTSGAGAIGIMQIMPNGYPEGEKLYPNWQTDPTQNIMLGAYILSQKMKDNGGSLEAGTEAYLGSGVDPYTGISTGQYLSSIQGYYGQLQQSGGTIGGGSPGTSANVINIATSFVGKIPYVWGGIPGKGETPTGWDCSGFTYWLDQNYGTGQLPMGSHYQFQYAQQTGKLFTNMSQLQPGDLIFFDTGDTAGAGADLNRAGHVAMYIGNGQIVQAGNPETGTNISTLSDYYTSRFIGAMHMSWSG